MRMDRRRVHWRSASPTPPGAVRPRNDARPEVVFRLAAGNVVVRLWALGAFVRGLLRIAAQALLPHRNTLVPVVVGLGTRWTRFVGSAPAEEMCGEAGDARDGEYRRCRRGDPSGRRPAVAARGTLACSCFLCLCRSRQARHQQARVCRAAALGRAVGEMLFSLSSVHLWLAGRDAAGCCPGGGRVEPAVASTLLSPR